MNGTKHAAMPTGHIDALRMQMEKGEHQKPRSIGQEYPQLSGMLDKNNALVNGTSMLTKAQKHCSSWCNDDIQLHNKSWSERCTFTSCLGCSECAASSTLTSGSSDRIHSSHSSHRNDSHGIPEERSSPKEVHGLQACPKNGVTACCKGDGFGAQYLAMMSVFAYSIANNVTFCPTPWSHIQHGVDAMDDGNGAVSMFSFVGGHLYGPPALPNTRKIETLYSQFESYAKHTDAIARIRAFYAATPKPALRYFSASSKAIAVHVRRGDVTPKDADRWTSIEKVAACTAKTIQLFGNQSITVHVFSDGTPEQLSGLQSFHPQLHLRDNVRTAFHHMVQADVFIMAKSSLSGTVAILRTKGPNFLADAGDACTA